MCICVCMLSHFSHVQLFVTLACQGPLSMGFFRQEYLIWLPCPPPGDLPDPGIKPMSLADARGLAGQFSTTWEDMLSSLLSGLFTGQLVTQ